MTKIVNLEISNEVYKKKKNWFLEAKPKLGYRYWYVNNNGELVSPIAGTNYIWASGINQAKQKGDTKSNGWLYSFNSLQKKKISYFNLESGIVNGTSDFDANGKLIKNKDPLQNGFTHTDYKNYASVIGAIWMFDCASHDNHGSGHLLGKYGCVASIILNKEYNYIDQDRISTASKLYNVNLVENGSQLKKDANEWLEYTFPYLIEEREFYTS